MNSYELLDLIGEAGEDYVLEADDSGTARLHPRWKSWTAAAAACAACAALVLLAQPALQSGIKGAGPEQDSVSALDTGPALHAYTVVEGGDGSVTPEGAESRTTAGGADASTPESIALPDPVPGGEPAPYPEFNAANEGFQAAAAPFADPPASDAFADAAGGAESVPSPEEAALGILTINQGTAIAQYQRLCRTCGVDSNPPEWYAGAWLDNDYENQECRLAVSIVAGYHTPELEAQIQDWCGGPVLFVQDMKYSYARLKSMLDQVNAALMDSLQDETWSAFSYMSTSLMDNCLDIGFSGLPSDEALAFLAQLDPEGDAIRVQAFTGRVHLDAADGPVISAEPTPPPIAEDPSQPK